MLSIAVGNVVYSECSQSITHIFLSILRKQLHTVTEINKALGMCRIKITISNNSNK